MTVEKATIENATLDLAAPEKSTGPNAIIKLTWRHKRYHFSPRPLVTLATLVVFALLLLLGFWQLHRAEVKRDILALYQSNSAMAPDKTYRVLTEPLPAQYQHISVTGHFLPAQHLLLDNRFNEHQVGYQVITPFKLEDSNIYLLINRGWIPRSLNRQIAAPITTPDEAQMVTLSGYVSYPNQRHFLLGPNTEPLSAGMTIVQNVTLDQFSQLLQQPLYPFVLLLDDKQPYGFMRTWNPVVMTPDMHRGYAVQWFALAATLLVIYIVINLKSEKIHD